ncbi:hypothetical protein ID866_6598 [Astraeus odoratus]|nr:hypothetical protein ID866_6598 [Astraeus odoratus]
MNGSSSMNGVAPNSGNGHHQQQHRNPYAPRASDFLNNVSNFKIIESTLREGEQFANAFFDTKTKIAIAKALDAFGVEYIELTSPAASEQSRLDCEAICKLGLRAKVLTHIRCHMDDAQIAVETGGYISRVITFSEAHPNLTEGVDGVDVVIGTSSFLREFSHGKDMTYITKTAIEVINFVKSKGIEVRFSTEDSFRSDLVDLLSIYQTVDKIGVNRVGIADTVGCANPRQVYDLVKTLRGVVGCDIEVHLHNDTGMAIANAYTALEAGATHIDTSVLGIGERVGITPLGGLVACLYAANPEYVKSKYNLPMLREIENLVAEAVEVNVPFMNPITGYCAFTHKAGIHAKAILNNPSTYEILKPEDFGLTRYVSIGHRLTGWNAVKSRVEQLGLKLTDDEIKDATAKIKELADVRTQSMDDVDSLLRVYHSGIQSGELAVGQREALDRLLRQHRQAAALEWADESADADTYPKSHSASPAPSSTTRHAVTPLDRQRSQLERLLKDPSKPAYIPPPPKEKTIRPAREMMKNVQGSSAGAGSGEFHVYKAGRRREYERLKMMEEETRMEAETADFERRKKEAEEQAEAKTAKNRARRQKKKERAKVKSAEKHGNGTVECRDGAMEIPIKKRRIVNGTELVFRRVGEESDSDEEPAGSNQSTLEELAIDGLGLQGPVEKVSGIALQPRIVIHDDV